MSVSVPIKKKLFRWMNKFEHIFLTSIKSERILKGIPKYSNHKICWLQNTNKLK